MEINFSSIKLKNQLLHKFTKEDLTDQEKIGALKNYIVKQNKRIQQLENQVILKHDSSKTQAFVIDALFKFRDEIELIQDQNHLAGIKKNIKKSLKRFYKLVHDL